MAKSENENKGTLIDDLKQLTPLRALEMLSETFFDEHAPLNHLVLCPKEDMNYSVGDLIRDIIKRERGK